jgi:hypothetical protein
VNSNDPLHLGTPGLMPGDNPAPFACDFCNEGSDEPLDRIGEHHVCDRCYWLKGCRQCHKRMANPADQDGYCTECAVGFYRRNPADFAEALPLLRSTEDGVLIADAVEAVGSQAATAEIEASKALIQRGQRQLTRQSISQHYREMAAECQEGA